MLIYQMAVTLVLLTFLPLVLRNLADYARVPRRMPERPERVSVLLPARNEAAHIEACLSGLLAQDYPHLEILVMDDCSTDDTAERVRRLSEKNPSLRLLSGRPLPVGWAGKVWACSQLAEAATGDWLLFLDADTRAEPALVSASLAHAQATGAEMLSTFPRQVTGTFPERVVLPMLNFLILTFLPVRLVWELPFPSLAAACGQFELFRRDAYDAVGGHAAVRSSFHDGLQLGRRIKAAGRRLRLFDGSDLIACRMYVGGRAVWNGFTRNAYEGLGSFPALLTLSLLPGLLFFAPFGFLLYGLAAGVSWTVWCAAQVALILLIRGVQTRRFGGFAAWILHPLSVAALIAIQWASWWKSRRGTAFQWKGRAYNNPETPIA